MKKLICVGIIVAIILSMFSFGYASGTEESILPPLNIAFGVCLPPLDEMYSSQFSGSTVTNNGGIRFEFKNITMEDYQSIGRVLAQYDCFLKSSVVSGNLLTAELTVSNQKIIVSYDLNQKWMDLIYPKYFYTETRAIVGSVEQSALPDLQTAFGVLLPRISNALNRLADSAEILEDGMMTETYYRFSEDDYNVVSQYLLEAECIVKDYYTAERVLVISLEKEGAPFILNYDPDNKTAFIQYPSGTRPEPETVIPLTPEPTAISSTTPSPKDTVQPTPTPKPTLTVDEYNQYAAIFVAVIQGTRTNPQSLQVHWIKIMEYKDNSYVVINFSAQNGLGGYNRDTYSFKFEVGHISLSGNSSDYDTYEKHKNEFKTIQSLDVDDVMRIVNK